MEGSLQGRDMITTQEWSGEEIQAILDTARDLKRKREVGEPHAYLRDKVISLLFFFTSTRTRNSFEAGMAQLGGHAQFIDSTTTQISHGDTAKEIGEILGVTESRVCQLHAEAVQRIRARVEGRPLASTRRRRKS